MPSDPLQNYYVIEWSFLTDRLHLLTLGEHLSENQAAFLSGGLRAGVILSLHPTEEGAEEEFAAWQEGRDKDPIQLRHRLSELQPYYDEFLRGSKAESDPSGTSS